LVDAQRRPYLKKVYEEVLEGNERETIVEVNRNGQKIVLENYFKPAKNNKGEIIGIAVSSKDITDKKKAGDKLMITGMREAFLTGLPASDLITWDANSRCI